MKVNTQVKILETIDYSLKRKGDRTYWIIDMKGRIIDKSGSWRSKAACMRRIQELRLEYVGLEVENKNYQHWADFVPVKEGRMIDA